MIDPFSTMPTYEYECPKGHHFEVFQKMSDEPIAACPECGGEARRKISGGAGFLFKGEGFYITDYRSEEYQKKASAERGEPSSKEPSSGGGAGDPAAGTKTSKTGSGTDSSGGSSKGASSGGGSSGGASSGSDG